MPGEYAPRGCEPPTASLLMGQPLAHERGEGAGGDREAPPHRVVRRGLVGATSFPPPQRSEGERRPSGLLHDDGTATATPSSVHRLSRCAQPRARTSSPT